MFRPWFLATLLTLAAAPAYAQTAAPATAPASGRVVSRIDFTGAASDVDRLRDLSTVKVGQPLSPSAVRDTLAVFYQKGLWSAVTADETAAPDGTAIVTFHFIPQLLLAEWTFNGNKNLSANVLARALDLSWGEPINPRAFEGYMSTIRDRYVREGFFNVKVKVEVAHVEENRGRLIVTIDEGKPLMLSAIKLLSTGPLSEREIVGELGVKPGERLPRDAAFQGLDRLEAQLSDKGFLNSRLSYYFVLPDGTRQTSYAALAEAKTASVEMVLAVEEGQRAIVMVDGDVILPVKELADAITVYKNRSYSPFELDFSANNLRDLYVSRGYPEAKVTHAVDRQPDGSYLITFMVNAGQRVSIQAIEFEGNKAYLSDQLRRVLQTQPSRAFLGGGAYVPDVWEADMANLVAWYETQGFQSAKVTAVDRLVDEETGHMTLVVHLAEGPRTMISRLLFKGASPAQEAGLLQALPINPGEAYNPRRLGDYIASVEAFYARTGYPVAKVTGAFEPGATAEQGALVFNVTPGPRKKIGHVILRGNLKTQDWVVRRQLSVETGDTYNSEEMLRTQQQIYQLGFFDRVNIGPLRPITSDPNDPVDLVVDLHERETGSVAVGGGFGDLQGPQGSAEYLQTNLLGTGRPVRLEGLLSQRRSSAIFTLRDPFLFGDSNIGELGASFLRDQPTLDPIEVTTYGPTFGLSRQITDHLLSSIRYSWSQTSYRFDPGVDPVQAAGLINRTNSIITTGLTFDSRSDILNPRWGTRTEVSVDLATPFLGGSLTYGRPRVSWAYFWPFPRQVTLALGAELGYIRTLETTAQLPTDLLFRAGGGNSIRGYTYNEVGVNGTTQGGQALLVSHVELRFPIRGDIGGVVFTDAGNVWDSTLDLNPTNVKLAAGFGLRYLTPVGPIRVDYAFRVYPQLDFGYGTRLEDLLGRHLYFGIGHAF